MSEIIDPGPISAQPAKRGPKPKELTEATIVGLPVGRDKKIVPPAQVQELAALGCKNVEIANFFGVTEDAISRNFAAELTKGREEMRISLRRAQLKLALSGNAVMLIWLGKNLLGQSDSPTDTEANAPLPWDSKDE